MRNEIYMFGLLIVSLLVGQAVSQSSSGLQSAQLCELQTKVAQGEHRSVEVEGVYLSGVEGQYLVTAGCSGRSTSIEFELKSHRLWKKLVQMSNKTNIQRHVPGDGDPIVVVFDGEFYGPRVPDPKLPDAIRKNYHAGWDHMNASMTKLVVHSIKNVQPLPADHPCAPAKPNSHQSPCWQNFPHDGFETTR
jgi:hypothetical protein